LVFMIAFLPLFIQGMHDLLVFSGVRF
jgi:hypothetical protein